MNWIRFKEELRAIHPEFKEEPRGEYPSFGYRSQQRSFRGHEGFVTGTRAVDLHVYAWPTFRVRLCVVLASAPGSRLFCQRIAPA